MCQDLAFLMDETFGKRSPIDSVIKLEGMMRCCKSQTDLIHWCLMSMSDLVLNREIRPAEMQANFLFGAKGAQKGSPGRIQSRCCSIFQFVIFFALCLKLSQNIQG